MQLFTFNPNPPRQFWAYHQMIIGSITRGKKFYVFKPENDKEDLEMRKVFLAEGYMPEQIMDIMNFIYRKL